MLSGPELVSECEQVISVQNQAWMAKWGRGGEHRYRHLMDADSNLPGGSQNP